MCSGRMYSNVLQKLQNIILRTCSAGLQKFFSGPVCGLINQPLVRDFQSGTPLVLILVVVIYGFHFIWIHFDKP